MSLWPLLALFFLILAKVNGYSSDCTTYNRQTSIDPKDTSKRYFVNCMGRDVESGQSELIVLIDGSGSMTSTTMMGGRRMNGFEISKNFIESLLSEVRISFNATRIAVGTFSDNSQINFNYILNPDYKNNKCKFRKDFSQIPFDRGMTNLKGSLNDAYNVFRELDSNPKKHFRRTRSNKVVLLLTDGAGNIYNGKIDWNNGQNARPEANNLKGIGYVVLYTVAATKYSDVNQLREIASHPSAFLHASTFSELSLLAKNIRGDPYERDYDQQNVARSLCNDCDPDANCACNLKTGDYKCICDRGYYGTGELLRNGGRSCKPCEPNTYGNVRGLLKRCTPCPANSITAHLNGRPALRLTDCKCKIGFRGTIRFPGDKCEPIPCVPAPNINNAVIKNLKECSLSTYKSRCYYKCHDEYKLSANSKDFIECTATGQWQMPIPKCELIECYADWISARDRDRYFVRCNKDLNSQSNSYRVGTQCKFQCEDRYYHKSGSTNVNCLKNGDWDNERIQCEEIKCPKVAKTSKNIHTRYGNCFDKESKVGDRCEFGCAPGYELRGLVRIIECLSGKDKKSATGMWNGYSDESDAPKCVDTEPPKFQDACNEKIIIKKNTEPGKHYAVVNFQEVNVTDNSGEEIKITCHLSDGQSCQYELGRKYNFDITNSKDINFKATDTSGNSKVCKFRVIVEDKEQPVKVKCPDNINMKTTNDFEYVIWDEPTFSDNCGKYPLSPGFDPKKDRNCTLKIYPNIPNGEKFKVNIPVMVEYTASDPSQNVNSECIFRVSVEKEVKTCPALEPPINGLVYYSTGLAIMYCRSGGYYPARPVAPIYLCDPIKLQWYDPYRMGELPLPDCVKKSPPTGVQMTIVQSLILQGDCNDPATKEAIVQKVSQSMHVDPSEFSYYCGTTTLVNRRKRSTSTQVSLKIQIVKEGDPEKIIADPTTELDKVKKDLETNVIPQKIAEMKKNDWSKINKNILRQLDAHEEGKATEKCVNRGEAQVGTSVKIELRCISCAPGTFKNIVTNNCESCPTGTYQPESGQTTCLSCPKFSIIKPGMNKNYTSCKAMCKPGEYSPNGLSPCFICSQGSYSDKYRQTNCTACPSGTTTVHEGRMSKYDCGSACMPGSYSKTGVEPCLPCPKGSYQPLHGQSMCKECPALQSTGSAGSASPASCQVMNDCASNPCMNGGNCVDLKDNFVCQCPLGFYGDRCQHEVNECALKPCANGAECIDKFNSYICKCLPGTGGRNCDRIVNRCKSNNCGQNGKCQNLPNYQYKCVCNDGYTGEFCETTVDICYPNPCKNNGFCTQSNNADKFLCSCPNGFTGATCEKNHNFCGSNPCRNGGECTDQTGGFACKCLPGYEGLQCERQTDMCKHTKCHNGGVCELLVNDVRCKCAPGFSGKQCEKKESHDFDLSFQTRVSQSYASVHGRKDMHHFTLAFWMRTNDNINQGTPVSYAVQQNGKVNDNAFFLSDYKGFDLAINNKTQPLELDANDGEWHHIAVTWSSENGIWKAYKDGVQVSQASQPLQKGHYIAKGGVFVIGEEQDSLEGDFTSHESFYGDLSQLNIWDRVFSSDEIYDLATNCGHELGNVVAWSDFAMDATGSIIKTSPSLACDFDNNLRLFQYLKDMDLPRYIKSKGTGQSHPNTPPNQCADKCVQNQQWCRAFNYNTKTKMCILYSTTILISMSTDIQHEPEVKPDMELYLLSCVTALGMTEGHILNGFITASSRKDYNYPHLARLYNTPKHGGTSAHWQPADDDSDPYLQIDLTRMTKITAIATQGSFLESSNEYASSYKLYFKDGNTWKLYKDFINGNKDPKTVVRHEMFVKTTMVKIKPKRGSASAIAMRVELYGCPDRPQGTPEKKADSNQCSQNPCKNGGRCYDLYKRYKCVCTTGYRGSTCADKVPCTEGDIDLGLGQRVILSKRNPYYWQAVFECNSGYQATGKKTAVCVNGVWTVNGGLQCNDLNECNHGVCSDSCENSHGSFRCLCPIGKTLDSNGRTCIDVNECNPNKAQCDNTCVNTIFNFKCQCPNGFHIKEKRKCFDRNECEDGTHNCQQLCENTLGGFRCQCKPGYKMSGDGRSCLRILCPTLPRITNLDLLNINETHAQYVCKSGYKINGNAVRKCLADGIWSGNTPKCESVRCTKLYSPENGRITRQDGEHYNSQVHFQCNTGYKMNAGGSSVRVCGNDANWNGKQPYCSLHKCPVFNVVNGKVLGLATQSGSVVRVECNEGYKLVRDEYLFRTCQNNGQWTGTGGNNAVVECKIIRCGNVPTSGNVQVKYTKGDVYQATVSYSCLSNLCLNGDNIRRCQSNGKWSGAPPSCLSNSCCRPRVPANAELFSSNVFSPGRNAYIKCDKGYVTSGDNFRECQSNLKWSGKDTKCTIVDCGNPSNLTNGYQISKGGSTYRGQMKYFCNPGYILRGSREQVCQADGKWSGTKPSCYKGNNGGHIRAKSGTLTCNSGEVCHWLIEITQGQKVSIFFEKFDLKEASDKTEVYDGKDKWEPYVTFTKDLRPRAITGNTNLLRIISSGYIKVQFKESSCGGLLSSKHGVITSPLFPNQYPKNLDCYWTIHRPYDRIQFGFLDFLLQQRGNTDHVTIYEGPFKNTDLILYRRYGYGIPVLNKEWADRWYWIHFKTDQAYSEKGFQGVWKLFEPRD